MALATEKLASLKKELQHRDMAELVRYCLELGRLKQENKAMLAYLLLDADDPMHYADMQKQEMDMLFEDVSDHYYYATKNLRKVAKITARYKKFTRHIQGETELLLHFLKGYAAHAPDYPHQPLQNLAYRAMLQLQKLIPRLHEDLQYDYQNELSNVLDDWKSTFRKWNHNKFPLGSLI